MFYGLAILFGVALLVLAALMTAMIAWRIAHPVRRTVGWAVANDLPTDPGEAGADYETITIEDADGRPLDLWLVTGDAANGPVVVMLHGWGDGRLGELLWLPRLKPLSSHLVLFDQRAQGESRQPRCTAGRREADDARRIVTWLRQRDPDRRVVLFGYSMGAVTAIRTAIGSGSDVDAVIADSPYRRFSDAAAGMMRLNQIPGSRLTPLATWLAGMLNEDTDHLAARMTQPLLILHGERDTIATHQQAQRIADAAPRGRMICFDDAAHLEAAALDPARYEKALEEAFSD